MRLYRRHQTWWTDFTVAGQRHRVSTGVHNRGEAEAEASRLFLAAQREAGDGSFNPAHGSSLATFNRYIDDLRGIGRTPATLIRYREYSFRFTEHFGDRPLATLTRADIEGWRDWLSNQRRRRYENETGTLAPKTVSSHLVWLAGVYGHFELPSPVAKVHRPVSSHADRQTALRVFSTAEVRLLIEHCPDTFRNALTVFLFTGCRRAELLGLRNDPEHLDDRRQMVWLTGKGSKRRQITLSGPATAAWDAIQAEVAGRCVAPGDRVFARSETWAYKRLEATCRAAGIPRRSPHALRHTFATHALLRWGWDISLLAKWLGHQNINITYAVYGHLLPNAPPTIAY